MTRILVAGPSTSSGSPACSRPSRSYSESMGSRGGQKTRPPAKKEASALLPPSPFHAPFRELAVAIQGKPSASPASRTTKPAAGNDVRHSDGERSIASVRDAAHKTVPLADSPAPLSDEDALAASLAGVEPLATPPSRVRIRRKIDLSHIEEGRRQDLAALDRAEGFDVTFEDH